MEFGTLPTQTGVARVLPKKASSILYLQIQLWSIYGADAKTEGRIMKKRGNTQNNVWQIYMYGDKGHC